MHILLIRTSSQSCLPTQQAKINFHKQPFQPTVVRNGYICVTMQARSQRLKARHTDQDQELDHAKREPHRLAELRARSLCGSLLDAPFLII